MKRLVVGPLEANCYLLWDPSDSSAVVVDPGDDAQLIEEEIQNEGLNVLYIINTHGHFDHVGASGHLRKKLGASLAIHPEDVPLLENAAQQGEYFGVETQAPNGPIGPDVELSDGMVIEAGSIKRTVLPTPGHTRGGVCLYIEKEGVVFTGDTLFTGSIGRTDLPGGSFDELMRSIREKLLTLGDTVKVFPGHGPGTTIKEEKLSNPFMTGEQGA